MVNDFSMPTSPSQRHCELKKELLDNELLKKLQMFIYVNYRQLIRLIKYEKVRNFFFEML